MAQNKNIAVLKKIFKLTVHRKARQICFCMFCKKGERTDSQMSALGTSEWLKIWSPFTSTLTSQTAGREPVSHRTSSPNVWVPSPPWYWRHLYQHPTSSPQQKTASHCREHKGTLFMDTCCECETSMLAATLNEIEKKNTDREANVNKYYILCILTQMWQWRVNKLWLCQNIELIKVAWTSSTKKHKDWLRLLYHREKKYRWQTHTYCSLI